MPLRKALRLSGSAAVLCLVLSGTAMATDVDDTLCTRWVKGRKEGPRFHLSALTRENAKRALAAMHAMVEEETGSFRLSTVNYREAKNYVKGYLLRKELENAWRNKEHDADELGDLCLFWAESAFGED